MRAGRIQLLRPAEPIPRASQKGYRDSYANSGSALGTACRCVGVVFAPICLLARRDAGYARPRPPRHIVVSRNSIPLDMLSRTPMASLGEPER
jgi:hypothetical protein